MAFTNGLGARVALVLFASSAHQYAAIDPLPCDEVEAAIPVDITDSPPLDISLRDWFNNKASASTPRIRHLSDREISPAGGEGRLDPPRDRPHDRPLGSPDRCGWCHKRLAGRVHK